MAKPEFGTKRTDPETGKKFYDLNRDPIVSPYTGISYPRSYFETSVEANNDEKDAVENKLDTALEKPEFVSLEDVEDGGKDDDLSNLNDDDDDAFLPEDDEHDDVSGIIGGGISSDNE
ncbi:MAG: hypothetical protein JSC189_000622 [Candidatus Tokpelaia sp. JSC189]|nr:MAG: hypothetical protein JSC189_000622 [Candidatus Tokpelaia sp. JSC189]